MKETATEENYFAESGFATEYVLFCPFLSWYVFLKISKKVQSSPCPVIKRGFKPGGKIRQVFEGNSQKACILLLKNEIICQKMGITTQDVGILLLKNEIICQKMGITTQDVGILLLKNEIICQKMGITTQDVGIPLLKNEIICQKMDITMQDVGIPLLKNEIICQKMGITTQEMVKTRQKIESTGQE
jgi:3-methyladenine DNA glycosylase Mpg